LDSTNDKAGEVCGTKVPEGFRAVVDPEIDLGGAHGERVEREPITGVWGGAPSGVQGGRGVRGRSPPEAESL